MDFNEIIVSYIFNNSNILTKEFYERDTAIVAKELLGKLLIIGNKDSFCGGFIVEDEAYYGLNDPASHACNGATPRSMIMFGKPGIAYVYFCYGNHYLLNVVTEKNGTPGAVLIRALEPVFGIEKMAARRRISDKYKLTKGPGNLTKSLGIDKNFNGKIMTAINQGIFIVNSSGIDFVLDKDIKDIEGIFRSYNDVNLKKDIGMTSRIGIKKGQESMLRFFIKDNKFVSGK